MIHQFQTISYNNTFEECRTRIEEYKRNALSKWTEEIRLTKTAIEQWNRMRPRPRFVVLCGDLVNDFPGEPLRRKQLDDFKRTFVENLDDSIPLVLLPGNHDILDVPTSESIENYRQEFGDDYFAFWVDGVMFIVINAQYYKDSSKVKQLALIHEQWIDEKLLEAKQNQYKHIIIFQHIPWFIHDVDEPEDEIFNIAIEERKRMLKKFNDNGVRAVFCGHYHRNSIAHYEDLELIITSAIGAQIPPLLEKNEEVSQSGYRIVKVDEDKLEHRYVNIE
ncbi:hypothetical protein SSS_04881 [Sarcoptes scabiei]|nr:hypothetical protein SSS_04881 [Sarcoptes scabiei]